MKGDALGCRAHTRGVRDLTLAFEPVPRPMVLDRAPNAEQLGELRGLVGPVVARPAPSGRSCATGRPVSCFGGRPMMTWCAGRRTSSRV
jgi:hypothetical protein